MAAIYDACVLFPFMLRDLLVQLAVMEVLRAKWTEEINDEWIRGVLRSHPEITSEQLERTRSLMNAAGRPFGCLVADYQELIPTLELPDPNDRHVLAAAIRGRASIIVTKNLKHFPTDVLSGHEIAVLHPDEFLCRLIDLNSTMVCAAVQACRTRMRNPPRTVEEYLADLERQELVQSVGRLRGLVELL
jgi:hypothetical protein